MKTALLRNVREEDWGLFKSEAAVHRMKMPEFFSYVLKEHVGKAHAVSRWKEILGWRSGRSDKEVAQVKKRLRLLRHRFKLER